MNRSHSNSSMLPSPSNGEDQGNEMRLKLALQASLLEKPFAPKDEVGHVFREPKLIGEEPPKKKKKKSNRNRCFGCRKKVGLLGFECRCGDVFCSVCRMPESHECTADWKTDIKSYEKVVASKLDKL